MSGNVPADPETVARVYRSLRLIRRTEEEIARIYPSDKIKSPVHLSIGQESVSVGVCDILDASDVISATYRGHAAYLAKGGDLKQMMAELYGKATGCAAGKAGSMHLVDMGANVLGMSAVVGTTIPVAAGYAFALQREGKGRIAASFFGDGATEEGVFSETLNFASLHKLPILFVCENNGYAMSTPAEYAVSITHVADRAQGYDMPGIHIDGMDVFAVYDATAQAVARARAGEGPTLIECETYRYYGHTVFDNPLTYRTKEEEDHWRARDPLMHFRNTVIPQGDITAEELDQMDMEAETLMEEAVKFADESPLPEPVELYDDVYVDYPKEMMKRGVNMSV